MFPRVICTDAEDGEIDRFELVESLRVGRVPGEENPLSLAFDDICVEAPVPIDETPCSPMGWLHRADMQIRDRQLAVLGNFMHGFKPVRNEIPASYRNDHSCLCVNQIDEGRAIEMIKVGMCDEDDVDTLERTRRYAGRVDSGESDRPGTNPHTNAWAHHGVDQHRVVSDLCKHAGMSQPDRCELMGVHVMDQFR